MKESRYNKDIVFRKRKITHVALRNILHVTGNLVFLRTETN